MLRQLTVIQTLQRHAKRQKKLAPDTVESDTMTVLLIDALCTRFSRWMRAAWNASITMLLTQLMTHLRRPLNTKMP